MPTTPLLSKGTIETGCDALVNAADPLPTAETSRKSGTTACACGANAMLRSVKIVAAARLVRRRRVVTSELVVMRADVTERGTSARYLLVKKRRRFGVTADEAREPHRHLGPPIIIFQ